MDNIRNAVNQMRFNRTKAKDDKKLEWGPTTYKVTFKNKSLGTAMFNALKFVGEGGHRVTDVHHEETPGHWHHIRVYYRKDQRIEDYNGEPCWLSEL